MIRAPVAKNQCLWSAAGSLECGARPQQAPPPPPPPAAGREGFYAAAGEGRAQGGSPGDDVLRRLASLPAVAAIQRALPQL